MDLIELLLSDEGYATGRKAFPRSVSKDDAVAIAGLMQREVNRGAAAREEAAAADGVRMACGRGCNFCCEELVMAYEPEALAAARWLNEPENAGARTAFLEAYPRWRDAVGAAPARLAGLIAGGDAKAYEAAHIEQWRKRILCAFNKDGDCTIYPVRPVNCRNGHAVDTSDRCRGDHPSGKPATRLAFKPLDEFLAKVRRLEQATHHAIGAPRRRPQALCDAVYRLLTKR